MKIGKKIIGIFVICTFIFFLTGCGTTTINLNDYFEVSISGTNGDGIAKIKWSDDIESDIASAMGKGSSIMDILVVEEAYDVSISPNKNLSNGDELDVKVSIDNNACKKYGIKFVGKNETFIVKDLNEEINNNISNSSLQEIIEEPMYKEIDLFDGITISFSGNSPYITASINGHSFYNSLGIEEEYSLDRDSFLENGDIVVVKVRYNEQKAMEKGYIINETSKEFKVSPTDYYIKSFDEISEENKDKIYKDAKDLIETKFYKGIDGSYDEGYGRLTIKDGDILDIELYSYFFFNCKATPNYYSTIPNAIYLVFKINNAYLTNAPAGPSITKQYKETYQIIQYSNILKAYEDDYLYYDSSKLEFRGTFTNYDTLRNEVILPNKADYNFVEEIISSKEDKSFELLEANCQIAANIEVPEHFDLPIFVVVYNLDTEEEYQINLLPENNFRGRIKVTPGEYMICQISVVDDLTGKYPFDFPYDTFALSSPNNYTITSRLLNYDEVAGMIEEFINNK